MKEQCYLVPGEFGIFIQLLLGCLSLTFLLVKYTLEKPRRLFLTFIKDLISILCGSIILHTLNIFLCIFIFQNNILLYIYNADIDECSVYFIHILIDATIGIYIEYKLFSLYKFIKLRKDYLCKNSQDSIYKPVDTLSHFTEFLKLMHDENKDNNENDEQEETEETETETETEYIKNEKGKIFNLLKRKFHKLLHIFKKRKRSNTENNSNENVWKYEKNDLAENNGLPKKDDEMKLGNSFQKNTYNNNEIFQNNSFTYEKKITLENKDAENKKFSYSSTNELIPINEETTQKKKFNFIYNVTLSDEYVEDEIVIFENQKTNINKAAYEKYDESNVYESVVIWVSVVLSMKTLVLIFFFISFPLLNTVAYYTVSSIGDMKFKLFFVMIIAPFFLNFINYFLVDNIIKSGHHHSTISKDDENF